MSKAYSQDLRESVILNYDRGVPKGIISELFNICIETINRWLRQRKKTGNIKPKVKIKHRQRKFSDEDLLNYVHLYPSATLEEIAQHFSVKSTSIHARLKKLGITRKKKHFFMRKEMSKHETNLSPY